MLDALGEQRREALAALEAIDALRAELVSGIVSGSLRPELHAAGEVEQ